ncbi:MAG: EamA family transporter [Parasporobacterium sp.]|nr:EamA family transporter [Parasporobacterium sp.]
MNQSKMNSEEKAFPSSGLHPGKTPLRGDLAGVLCVTAGAVLWGMIGLFTRKLNSVGLDSMKIVCVRMIGSALILGLFFLFTDRKMFRIRLQDLWMFFGTGIVSHVLYNWCYFHCIRISSLSVSAALLQTAPSFSILMSMLIFHERCTLRKALALVLTMAGCILVTGAVGKAENISSMAIVSGLGAGFGFALYSVFGRIALKRYTPIQITFWTNVCGGAFSLVLVNQLGLFRQLMHANVTETVLLLIIFGTILPLGLYTKGLIYLENGYAGILAALEPVVALLISVLIFHEEITLSQLLGIVLVISAEAILAVQHRVLGDYSGKKAHINDAPGRAGDGRSS